MAAVETLLNRFYEQPGVVGDSQLLDAFEKRDESALQKAWRSWIHAQKAMDTAIQGSLSRGYSRAMISSKGSTTSSSGPSELLPRRSAGCGSTSHAKPWDPRPRRGIRGRPSRSNHGRTGSFPRCTCSSQILSEPHPPRRSERRRGPADLDGGPHGDLGDPRRR